jgi:hypothetical protein
LQHPIPVASPPVAPDRTKVPGVLPSADVALIGLQDAASVRTAILDLYGRGHRSIGIGRNGVLEIARSQHQHRVQLPDGVVLAGGHVRNGLWHAGNGCRIVGGFWERDDPAATDATMFRVGDVGDPREDVVFEGLHTRIGPNAGASVYPYDIRNGAKVLVQNCCHVSEVREPLGPDQGGGYRSGQAFCVGAGSWDVTIRGNRAEVLAEDDFVNFSSSFRQSGRIRVTDNVAKGFDNLAAAVDCEGMHVVGNVGENVRHAFLGKAAWYSPGPATVRGICLAHNLLFDAQGVQWRQVAMLLAGEGGLIEDVLIDGCQVHAHPAVPGTNMVDAITREGGIIRDFRAANVNVTTQAPLARLLATRGPGVMRDFELARRERGRRADLRYPGRVRAGHSVSPQRAGRDRPGDMTLPLQPSRPRLPPPPRDLAGPGGTILAAAH